MKIALFDWIASSLHSSNDKEVYVLNNGGMGLVGNYKILKSPCGAIFVILYLVINILENEKI